MTDSPDTKGRRLAVRFERLEDARRALQELENHGIDGVDLRLVGDRRAQARRSLTTSGPDRRFGRYVSALVLRGMALGTVLGIFVGLFVVVVGRLLSDGFADRFASAALIIVGIAFLGWVLGTFLTFERGVGFSESWAVTFDDIPDGASWLLVEGAGPDLVPKLQEIGASEVVTVEGDRVPWQSDEPEPGVAKDAMTLTDVLSDASARGYVSDFRAEPEGRVQCLSCHQSFDTTRATVHDVHRLEGASDPADMLAVVSLTCPVCGAQGTIVLNYGPESTPEQDDILRALDLAPPAS